MKRVSKLLKPALGRDEVLRSARASSVLAHWTEVVGEALAERSAPDRYDRGTVWVAVKGSAWAQELRMIKPVILERLESLAAERGLFHDVRFGVRPFQPQAVVAAPEPAMALTYAEASISEIAARRWRIWQDEEPA